MKDRFLREARHRARDRAGGVPVPCGGGILSFAALFVQAKLLTTVGILLALFGGFVIYPEEAAFYKAKREAASDPWALTYFQSKYPASRRMGEVDDLMWQATNGPKGDWAVFVQGAFWVRKAQGRA